MPKIPLFCKKIISTAVDQGKGSRRKSRDRGTEKDVQQEEQGHEDDGPAHGPPCPLEDHEDEKSPRAISQSLGIPVRISMAPVSQLAYMDMPMLARNKKASTMK